MKTLRNVTILAAMALVLAMVPAGAMSPVLEEIENAFVRLHEEVNPTVVYIETKGSTDERQQMPRMEDFFRFFGMPNPQDQEEPRGRRMPRPRASGSGFIYSADGYVVTNNHVVEDAEDITVRLHDGTEYDAEIVGRDPDTDLAVIKVDTEGRKLAAAKMGDSDALKVGQFAIAMGSPRGFEGSLSFGHISALGRDGLGGLAVQGLRFQNLIQTDAAINLGNSGGPLCNISGEVVGINVAIIYGANNLGFAIPVNKAKEVVPLLIAEGHVTRGYLGVGVRDADDGFGESVGMSDGAGAFVKEVRPDTPAEKAGIQVYDVLRKVNGKVIEGASGLVSTISSYAPGETVQVEIWRDGETLTIPVTLDEWNPERANSTVERESAVVGLRLRDLTDDIRRRFQLDEDVTGVFVVDVEPGSPAEDAGIMHGDIITEMDREPVSSVDGFRRIAREKATPGAALLVRYLRGGDDGDITVLKIPQD